MKRSIFAAALLCGIGGLAAVTLTPATQAQQAPQPSVERKVLMTHDLAVPGYQSVLAAVTIPPGGREGRHTHPGAVIAYIQQGALTVDYEGQPTKVYKAGDALFIEAGKIHEGMNKGKTPVKIVATFVVEKGKPMTTQVP